MSIHATASGRLIHKTELPEDASYTALLLPDGKTLALSGFAEAVIMYDVESRKVTARLKGEEKYPAEFPKEEFKKFGFKTTCRENWTRRLAVSPDGKWLAVSTDGGWLSVWDVTRKKRLWRKQDGDGKSSAQHRSLSFSPDGETLATIGKRSVETRFWQRKDGAWQNAVRSRTLHHALYLPDGTMIFDRWRAYDHKALPGSPSTGFGRFGFIRWHPTEDRYWGTMWDVKSEILTSPQPDSIVVSANGHTLALFNEKAGLHVYDLRTFWPRP